MSTSADEVLAARAEALARPVDRRDETRSQWIVVAIGEARIAVPAERAEVVLGPAPIARVPRPDASAIVGIRTRTGGGLLAVADVSSLIGVVVSRSAEEQDVVVLGDPTSPVGLLVDAVEGLREADALMRVEADGELIRGVGGSGELVLDVDALLAHPRLGSAATDPPDPTKGPS